jgi:hypothetical protein
VLSHRHVQLNRSLSHCVSHENHLEYHIISTLCTEDTSTSLHLRLRENDTPNSLVSSPHRGTQHSIYVSEKNHTPSSWASSPHKGTQHSISVLEMNHTHGLPHPTHGNNVPSPSQRETTHPSHGHTQLMGSISGRITQSVSWRMSHVVVIINTFLMFPSPMILMCCGCSLFLGGIVLGDITL